MFIDHDCFEIVIFCSVGELYCCGRDSTKSKERHERTKILPTIDQQPSAIMSNLMTSWLLKETAAYAKRSIEEGLDEDDNQQMRGGPVQIVKVSLETES